MSRRTADPHQRRAEIVIASLFLLTAAASIPAAFALEPGLFGSDYLARIFPNRAALALDALLWTFNNIGIVFIAVFALPVLRRLDEALAVGYLASRIVEGTIMMAASWRRSCLSPSASSFWRRVRLRTRGF
jgi:Domain of unknown function (DUF4386)